MSTTHDDISTPSTASCDSFVLVGTTAIPVTVRATISDRLPSFQVVGPSLASAKEIAARVRSALEASGFSFPRKRIVVEIEGPPRDDGSPLPIVGTHFDLPVAVAVMAASSHIHPDRLEGIVAAGELSLFGDVREFRGAACLGRMGAKRLLLPRGGAMQILATSWPRSFRVTALDRLSDLDQALSSDTALLKPEQVRIEYAEGISPVPDWSDIGGLPFDLQRQIETTVRLGLSVAFVGSPGTGRTRIAMRLPTLVPDLSEIERRNLFAIYSAAGLPLVARRPFRAPHHSVSIAGMVGGRDGRPGEIHLADQGVLFLDEAEHFSRPVLEALGSVWRHGFSRPDPKLSHVLVHTTPRLVVSSVSSFDGLARVERGLGHRFDVIVDLDRYAGGTPFGKGPKLTSAEVRARIAGTSEEGSAQEVT